MIRSCCSTTGSSPARSAVTATPASAAVPDQVRISPTTASVTGETVLLAATVTGSAGTPTGQVDVLDGVTPICTGLTLVEVVPGAAAAECPTSSLTVGNHNITAQYGGGNYDPDTSAIEVQEVFRHRPRR